MRPWNERSIALEKTEGSYCDYVAFLEWFDRQLAPGPWHDLKDVIETHETNGMIPLYTLFCDAYDGANA